MPDGGLQVARWPLGRPGQIEFEFIVDHDPIPVTTKSHDGTRATEALLPGNLKLLARTRIVIVNKVTGSELEVRVSLASFAASAGCEGLPAGQNSDSTDLSFTVTVVVRLTTTVREQRHPAVR